MDFVINEHFPDLGIKTHKYLVRNQFFIESSFFFMMPPYYTMYLLKKFIVLFLGLQEFFSKVVSMTAELIAKWQAVGFAHGKIAAAVNRFFFFNSFLEK